MELCQPELNTDVSALNARLTRLEEQWKTGAVAAPPKAAKPAVPVEDEELPPPPDDDDAPPEAEDSPAPKPQNDAPAGFWLDLCGGVRKELKPPVTGFFAGTPNAPVQGVLTGGKLELQCTNAFTAQMLDKPEILEVVSRKAAVMLNRQIQAVVVDLSAKPKGNPRMEQLMQFGREHADIVKIKE